MNAEFHKVTADAKFKLLGGDDSPNGSFSGYGAVFGNYDRVNEAVAPDAFKNLDEFVSSGFITVGHDWNALPIATIKSAAPDDYGLHIEAEFHSTPAAQEARQVLNERMQRGKFVGLSIGYKVNDSEATDKGRILKDLSLYETSIVTVPANPLAGVTGSKGGAPDALTLDDHTEQVLVQAKALTTRLKGVNDLRAKDNRTISATRRADLIELKALVDELISLTAPQADADKVRALRARLMASLDD